MKTTGMQSKINLTSLTLAMLLVGMIATAVPAAAQPGRGGCLQGDGPGFSKEPFAALGESTELAEALGLTAEQQEQIEKIREAAAPKRRELRKQMRQLRHDLKGEFLKDEPDKSSVVQLVVQIGDVQTQLRLNGVEQRLAILEVLTPEQREKLPELMPRRGRHGMRGHGRGHGMRGPGTGQGMRGSGPGQCFGNGPGGSR
jgi:Spy/CpxP family protein refolding chaperone